jgi:hypothetical protein
MGNGFSYAVGIRSDWREGGFREARIGLSGIFNH